MLERRVVPAITLARVFELSAAHHGRGTEGGWQHDPTAVGVESDVLALSGRPYSAAPRLATEPLPIRILKIDAQGSDSAGLE